MGLPLYRGQGPESFKTSTPIKAAKRGQTYTYDINGRSTGGTGATLTPRTISATGDGAWSVTFDGSANVTAALTLAPVNANTGTFGGATTSPQFSVDGKGRITGVAAVTITPAFSSITGTPTTLAGYGIVLTSGNVTTALGFTPYNATNPSGYISSITSSMVTTALGYTPTSVTGLTGAQTVAAFKTGLALVKADVGLGSVDNTSDATKAVLSATKWTTPRNIDGQAVDGTANVTVIAPATHAATSKATPVDADELPLVDSAAANVLAKLTWANLKATLKTYFDTLYGSLASANSWLGLQTMSGGLTVPASKITKLFGGGLGYCCVTDAGGAPALSFTDGGVTTYASIVSGPAQIVVNGPTGGSVLFQLGGTNYLAMSSTLFDLVPNFRTAGTVTGSNLSGTNTGDQTSVSGNAGTATKLQTPRNINGVPFDGSANVTIPGSTISVVTKTAGYTETTTSGEIIILASFAAGGTIVLPTAVGNTTKYTVKKLLAASTVVIDGNASETIDGGLTATLTNQYETISFVSDNANWWII